MAATHRVLLLFTIVTIFGQLCLAQKSQEVAEAEQVPPCPLSPPQPPGSEVTIAELNFEGDLHLAIADQDKIIATFKQPTYSDDRDRVTDDLLERVRQAWEDHGYFKVQVRGDSRTLTRSPVSERIGLTVHVEEGPQYRLRRITFKNNKAITNAEALRNQFPIKDGDIFSREAIVKGLENLRKAYGQLGYINFAFVPETTINEDDQTISLTVDSDEGKQFFISSIHIVGADAQVLSDLALTPGQIYNARLIELFLRKHLPRADVNDPSIQRRLLNERKGTVALVFDFRRCPAE